MIDKNKTYKTRDGREVRIYAVDGGGDFPNHGAYHHPDGIWVPCQWVPSGKFLAGSEHPRDLIEVKPRIQREVWVNVYPDGHFNTNCACVGYGEKKDADHAAFKRDRIACVKLTIDCEEGTGL